MRLLACHGSSAAPDWLSTLSVLQRQQVDALLSRLRCEGSVALVHKLEWFRLLYRLRTLMRDGVAIHGDGIRTVLTAREGQSGSQLFMHYLSTSLPHDSPHHVQEQLGKLHQLLRIADQREDAEAGAAKALFERLCAPLSPDDLCRVQGSSSSKSSCSQELNDVCGTAAAASADLPVLRHKRKRCDTTAPHLTLKSFIQVASLLPRFQQWCHSRQDMDWEASLRIYLYSPTKEVRVRILRDMEVRGKLKPASRSPPSELCVDVQLRRHAKFGFRSCHCAVRSSVSLLIYFFCFFCGHGDVLFVRDTSSSRRMQHLWRGLYLPLPLRLLPVSLPLRSRCCPPSQLHPNAQFQRPHWPRRKEQQLQQHRCCDRRGF